MSNLAADLDELQRQRARRRAFTLAFLAVLICGLVYTALQPRMYRSSATVLMSAPTAIDRQVLDADVQGVAIQRRILLGSDVTERLAAELARRTGGRADPAALREQLVVEAVPETNLLELAAQSGEREILPTLVQAWIDVYTDVRAADIRARKDQTVREVEDEVTGLAARLEAARAALEDFREANGIISMERQENAVLSRLDGLNKALNTAIEDEVRAQAYLTSLRESLAAGQQVVPQSERAEVAEMAKRLSSLRARYDDLRGSYTEEYIRKDPRWRDIPGQIEELETKLAQSYSEGSRAELANAERAWTSARDSVAELERRLDEHKAEVASFNTVYAEHETLAADLARLEELNRSAQARLVQVEVNPVEKYPQIAVVDWPAPQAARVGPDYLLLLGITALGALGAGIFAAWLYGYLNPRTTPPGYITLSGVHMYPGDTQALERVAGAAAALGEEQGRRLEHSADEPESDGDDEGEAER